LIHFEFQKRQTWNTFHGDLFINTSLKINYISMSSSSSISGSAPAAAASSGAFESPWIEKYRPEFLRDVVGNGEAVARLAAIAQSGNMPNIILAGPPGIGKTTR
jgi:replication factor C subunit 2/4